jgi:hypothetical protein
VGDTEAIFGWLLPLNPLKGTLSANEQSPLIDLN